MHTLDTQWRILRGSSNWARFTGKVIVSGLIAEEIGVFAQQCGHRQVPPHAASEA